jgi:hypothetical protein
MKPNRSAWIGLLGLAWLLGIVLLYYAGHKPVTPEGILALVLAAWRLLSALLLVTLAGAVGHWIFARWFDLPPLVNLALQGGLGLGIFSLSILIVGNTLGLPAWLLWLALPVLAVLLRRHLAAWLKQAAGMAGLWQSAGRLGKALGILLGLIFLAELFVALAPPVYFDALVDHLVMANDYIAQGSARFLPSIAMSGMPQNAEMLYTWAITLGGNQAAAVLCWLAGLLAVIGLSGYIQLRLGGRSAWVGAAALLAGYTSVVLLSSAYVDWLALLFGSGMLVSLDVWGNSGSRKALLLAGVFAGLAGGTKYTALVLILAGIGVLAWQAWKRRLAVLPVFLGFGVSALVAFSPWLVKNGLATGNPFYPFFFTSSVASQVHFEVFQRVNPWGNVLDFFILPVRATLVGFDLADGYMFSVGPLLLALGVLAWLGYKKMLAPQRLAVQNAFLISIVGLLVWAVGNQYSGRLIQTRYYMAIFPAFAVLAAAGDWGLRQLTIARVRLGRLAAVVILLAAGLNLLESGLKTIQSGAPQAALGLKTQDSYLADNLGWYQPAMQAVNDLPQGSRVLLLYEPRSLYCLPRCTGDEIMDRWKQARALYEDDPSRIRAAWIAEGYTHLLVYRQGVEFLVGANDPNHTPDDLRTLNAFLANLSAPEKLGGIYELYDLK